MLYPYFDSLILAVFCAEIISIFQDNINTFLILNTALRGTFRNLSRGGSRTAAISKMERAASKMERFVIIVNGFQPLTIITKHSILDVAAVLDPPLLSNIYDKAFCKISQYFLPFDNFCSKLHFRYLTGSECACEYIY